MMGKGSGETTSTHADRATTPSILFGFVVRFLQFLIDALIPGRSAINSRRRDSENVLSRLRDTSPDEPRCDQFVVFQAGPLAWRDNQSGEFRPIDMLDFDCEREVLSESLNDAGIDLIFETATTERLVAVLTTRKAHVLHLSCHGYPTCLCLEDGSGGVQFFSVEGLKELLLVGSRLPCFVFVSACSSRAAAQAFIDAGVPHVLCSQAKEPVLDVAMIEFCRSFYRALSYGRTLLEAYELGKQAVKHSPVIPDAEKEMDKLVLLPEGSAHDEPIFDSEARGSNDHPIGGTSPPSWILPHPPKKFVGRELEMYRVLQALLKSRLVRVTGSAGMGKVSLISAVCSYIRSRSLLSIQEIIWLPLLGPPLKCTAREDKLASSFHTLFDILRDESVECIMVQTDSQYKKPFWTVIETLHQTRALVVIEAKEFLGVQGINKLSSFLQNLFRATKYVKVILIGQPGVDVSLHNSCIEAEIALDPLSFKASAILFGTVCPYVSEGRCPKIRSPRQLSRLLVPKSQRNLKKFDKSMSKRTVDIFTLIGEGIPSKVLAAAGRMQPLEYDRLIEIGEKKACWAKVKTRAELEHQLEELGELLQIAVRVQNFPMAKEMQEEFEELERFRESFPGVSELRDKASRLNIELEHAISAKQFGKAERLHDDLAFLDGQIKQEEDALRQFSNSHRQILPVPPIENKSSRVSVPLNTKQCSVVSSTGVDQHNGSLKKKATKSPVGESPEQSAVPDVSVSDSSAEPKGHDVENGRAILQAIIDSDSQPQPVPLGYLENCTNGFSDDRWLGGGAFGQVYLGIDKVLRRKFAVKRLQIRRISDRDATARKKDFQRELETLERFRHPNISRLYAHCLSENLSGPQLLVFDFAANGSLDKFFKAVEGRKKLHWTTRIKIAYDVVKALCFLHQGKGGQICFHGDIKPANICLKKDFTALLIDCGLSKMVPVDDSAMTLSIMSSTCSPAGGTPGYICPTYAESFLFGKRDRKYTSESDVYSLGIVLAELYTGRLQGSEVDGEETQFFDFFSMDGKDKRELKEEADIHAGEWEKKYRDEFAALVVECIAKEPGDRPRIEEIDQRLAALFSGAKPWSPGERNSIHFLFSNPLVWMEENATIHPVQPHLHFGQERDVLNRCIKESERDIKVSFDVATNDRLQELAAARCGCLHFSGHGCEPSHLVFEDGKGGADFVGADLLPTIIRHPEPFRIVVISATHSEPVGRAFLNAGVRHVVCCEHNSELRDGAAVEFTRGFYGALAKGYTVKSAFNSGKDAVHVSYRSEEESRKFILLPDDEDHDVPIFDADRLEWIDDPKIERPLIPAAPVLFFGREIIMHSVVYSLLSMKRLVTVVGERCVGHTSLASAVCHYISDRVNALDGIDNVFYVQRNRDVSDLDEALLRPFYEQMMIAGDNMLEETELSQRICRALNGMKALIVFDGIDGMEESLCDFFQLLFSNTVGVKILATGGKPTSFSSSSVVEETYRLEPLDNENAATLFGKTCPHAGTEAEQSNLTSLFLSRLSVENVAKSTEGGGCALDSVREGVPSKIIEAAKAISRDAYNRLFLDPLVFESAAMLFGVVCPHATTWAERSDLRNALLSIGSSATDDNFSESTRCLLGTISQCIPAAIIEAATEMSREDYMDLIKLAEGKKTDSCVPVHPA